MPSTNAFTPPTVSPREPEWTTRALLARHRRVALAGVAVVAVMVALLVIGIVGSDAGAVSDRSTCSAWSSANQAQQAAYAALYIHEHGPLSSGATDAASVQAAIDKGCMQAFGSDAADLVNVEQAINRQY